MTSPVRKAATCGVGPRSGVCGRPGHVMVVLQAFDDLRAFEADEAPVPRLALFCAQHAALAELTPVSDGQLEALVTKALQYPEQVLGAPEAGEPEELWATRVRAVMATLMAAGWQQMDPGDPAVGERVRYRLRPEDPWHGGVLLSVDDEHGATVLTDDGNTVTLELRIKREQPR